MKSTVLVKVLQIKEHSITVKPPFMKSTVLVKVLQIKEHSVTVRNLLS